MSCSRIRLLETHKQMWLVLFFLTFWIMTFISTKTFLLLVLLALFHNNQIKLITITTSNVLQGKDKNNKVASFTNILQKAATCFNILNLNIWKEYRDFFSLELSVKNGNTTKWAGLVSCSHTGYTHIYGSAGGNSLLVLTEKNKGSFVNVY